MLGTSFEGRALFCYVAHFVSSPLIKLIMTALAKLSLELGSECSKTGGRANILMSDLMYPTPSPIMGNLRPV